MSNRTAIIADIVFTFAVGLLLRLTLYVFYRGVEKGRSLNKS